MCAQEMSPEDVFDLISMAEKGNYKAQFKLGQMYLDGGDLVEKDEAKGVELIMKAAEPGDPHIHWYLGIMYQYGKGVTQDYAKAVEWYKKSAEQGYNLGQFRLATMYRDGMGVAKDETKAVEWFQKAAEQGNSYAQFWLAVMYSKGLGVAKDSSKAEEWYKKAEKGINVVDTYNELAYWYANKGDYDEAIATIDKAIQLKPNDPNFYDSKGEILSMKGDRDGAKAMWDKIISLDPKYGDNNTNLYRYLFPSN